MTLRFLSTIALAVSSLFATLAPSSGQSLLATVPVATGLSGPTFITAPVGDARRIFFTELNTGLIRIVQDGALLSAAFLDVSAASATPMQQLYSMAFHPDYDQNGLFYVYYVAAAGGAVVQRFSVSQADPNRAEPTSGQVIFTTAFAVSGHAGHGPVFGPEGMLYIATGNGNNTATPDCVSQDPTSPLGKILRVDVDAGTPYAIPPDNPFVGVAGYLPEIWALGLRQPWRMSFDRLTGELYVGDVGQADREEVDHEPAGFRGGRNYGWGVEEGSTPIAAACPPGTPPYGDPAYTRPIHEYDHGQGCSITGGYVYRGTQIPSLAGTYLFGDFCANATQGLWSLRYENGAVTDLRNRTQELQPQVGGPIDQVVTFGEDGVGELYVVDLGGTIYKIVRRCGFESYCESNPNSTGARASAVGGGSARVHVNRMVLSATDMPPNRFGYYLMSDTPDFVRMFGGGAGNLCLAPPIYRFAGEVWNTGASGAVTFVPDLFDLPQGAVVQAGETWCFQAWFRDSDPNLTSNTTNGVSVLFCP